MAEPARFVANFVLNFVDEDRDEEPVRPFFPQSIRTTGPLPAHSAPRGHAIPARPALLVYSGRLETLVILSVPSSRI